MDKMVKGAVIVLFFPDSDIFDKINLYSSLLNYVCVYDNTPNSTDGKAGAEETKLKINALCHNLENVQLLSSGQNVGVATALNRGVDWCVEQGCTDIFLFDQDSKPASSDYFEKMCGELSRLNANDKSIICLAPDIKDEASQDISCKWLANNNSCIFKRSSLDDDWDGSILVAITSGTLIYASAFKSIGYFRDDFFIDYVDTEYCLRLVNRGYKIMASRTATLLHNLGERSVHTLFGHKFYPTNHSSIRRYYIARNSVYMWKMYALSNMGWAVFDLLASIYNAFRIVAFENKKQEKIKSSLSGFYDGLRGRVGVRK